MRPIEWSSVAGAALVAVWATLAPIAGSLGAIAGSPGPLTGSLRSPPLPALRGEGRVRGFVLLAPLTGSRAQPLLPQTPMGEAIRGLAPEELARFEAGRVSFVTSITVEEGLGPLFNMSNCVFCHDTPIGGQGERRVVRFAREEGGVYDPLEELGGTLLQANAIDVVCHEEMPEEANVSGERVTSGSQGYGLIEAIPDAQILALAQRPAPGTSGRAHLIETPEAPGTLRVGRFGWKAQSATILAASAEAALMEMGLTNVLFPDEVDPNGVDPPEASLCDDVPDPEDEGLVAAVTDFMRFMADPPRTPRTGMRGEVIFAEIGCTGCHVKQFVTADDPALEPALRGRVIEPFGDFLLHDMGEAGDFIPEGDAEPGEVKTPPLWGLRSKIRLWHDGRFITGNFDKGVRSVIAAHGAAGSEGVASAASWDSLAPEDQVDVIAFLGSLGRVEFDEDFDGRVTLPDFLQFMGCLHDSTEGATFGPDDACAVHDIDQDGDVDLDDHASLIIAYDDPLFDCDGDGVPDLTWIAAGGADANANGVPDPCDACPWDLDGSGAVGAGDLLLLFGAWGPCSPACPGDFDADGRVQFNDLTTMLRAWGACA